MDVLFGTWNPIRMTCGCGSASSPSACPEGMHIELLALYLPQESLDGIGEEMVSRRTGGEQ